MFASHTYKDEVIHKCWIGLQLTEHSGKRQQALALQMEPFQLDLRGGGGGGRGCKAPMLWDLILTAADHNTPNIHLHVAF